MGVLVAHSVALVSSQYGVVVMAGLTGIAVEVECGFDCEILQFSGGSYYMRLKFSHSH